MLRAQVLVVRLRQRVNHTIRYGLVRIRRRRVVDKTLKLSEEAAGLYQVVNHRFAIGVVVALHNARGQKVNVSWDRTGGDQ